MLHTPAAVPSHGDVCESKQTPLSLNCFHQIFYQDEKITIHTHKAEPGTRSSVPHTAEISLWTGLGMSLRQGNKGPLLWSGFL